MRASLLVLLLAALFSPLARSEIYKDPYLGIEFPENLSGFVRDEIKPYQASPGEAGVAINYSTQGVVVTLYIRELDRAAPPLTAASLLQNTLAAIKELERRGEFSNVKIYSSDKTAEKPGWNSAAFTADASDGFLFSFIFCRIASGHPVKIRATTGNADHREQLQSFAHQLQDMVDQATPQP